MLSLNYDTNNDILYIAFADKSFSYGDEISDGYVVMKDVLSDEITGATIFDFMHKYNAGIISFLGLPINIDIEKDIMPHLR